MDTNDRGDRPTPMQALAMAMAWFASVRRGLASARWRIEQDEDGSVLIVTDGAAPGLCITPGDGGYALAGWHADGRQFECGPYATLEDALAAASVILGRHRDRQAALVRWDA